MWTKEDKKKCKHCIKCNRSVTLITNRNYEVTILNFNKNKNNEIVCIDC